MLLPPVSADCIEVRTGLTKVLLLGSSLTPGLLPPLLLEAPKRAVKLYSTKSINSL